MCNVCLGCGGLQLVVSINQPLSKKDKTKGWKCICDGPTGIVVADNFILLVNTNEMITHNLVH